MHYLLLQIVLIVLMVPSLVSAWEPGEKSPYHRTTIEQKVRETNGKAIKSIYDFFGGAQTNVTGVPLTPQPTQSTGISPTTTSSPTSVPTQFPPDQSFLALEDLYKSIGAKLAVPTCLLETVSRIEYGRAWNFSPGQILQYSSPNQEIIYCHESSETPPFRGSWNTYAAKGSMQMTVGESVTGGNICHGKKCQNAWGSFGQAIRKYENVTWTPNVCNLKDAGYGAAQKLKTNSGTPVDRIAWTRDEMEYAGARYYGSSTQKIGRLGNRTYGEYLWYICSLK